MSKHVVLLIYIAHSTDVMQFWHQQLCATLQTILQ